MNGILIGKTRGLLAVFLLGIGLLSGNVASAITVTASPTGCINAAGIGTVSWSSSGNAVSSNNSFAAAAVDGSTTRYLLCTGYNFAVPAGATINGITVTVERRSSSTANGGSRDAAVRVLKAGSVGATDRSTATIYTTTDATEAHGGAADLWGTTWTPAQINATNFGAAFAATKPNAAGAAHTIRVDHIQITVNYSLPPGTHSLAASPTNCASVTGIGTVSWSNSGRAISSNNSYATASVDGSTTRYLRCTGYNFTIPAEAAINGITVTVERRSSSTANGGSRDAAVRVVKAGSVGATDRSTATIYTTADATEAHGGAADLWGTTWTPAQINAANFGAAFAATKPNAAGAAHTIRVDHIRVTVTITIPPCSVCGSITNGLQACYKFENNYSDLSGNGNNGTGMGGVGFAAGKSGNAINLDGSSGYVNLPNTPALNFGNNVGYTFTGWVRTSDAYGQVVSFRDQTNDTPVIDLAIGYNGAAAAAGRFIPLVRHDAGGIAYFTNGPAVDDGQWHFVALVYDPAAGKIISYMDGGMAETPHVYPSSLTTAGFRNIGREGRWVAVGFTSTDREYLNGLIDEVRIFNRALSASEIATVMGESGGGCAAPSPLHHLEIQSGGSGLTCAASTLTVKACTDAAIPCTTPYTGGVSGTLSATGAAMTVNWDGTTGGAAGAGFAIPNGGSQVTKNVQVATAGSVVFGVSSAAPAPTSTATCNFGTPACTFTASLAGFIFSGTSTGNTYTVPDQVSGIAAPGFYLRAVQASTTNPAICTPAIIGQTTAVNMGYACNNPATCQVGNLATINATAIAPAGSPVNLSFDANGSAPITARYDDVGRITLNASKTVIPFGGATAVTLNGGSNEFVVAPHHFGFSGITAGPIKAGNDFSATVTAYNGLATPAATPNFGKETTPEGVTLSFGKYRPTGAGAVNGNFTGSVGAFNNGAATSTNLNWSEVGIIDLAATLTSGNYLGSGLTATGTTGGAGAVGRFIPDHFDTAITDGCPSCGFTYSGQPFTVYVTAMNGLSTPTATANYDGTASTSPNFAKAVTLTAWDAATGAAQNPGPGALLPPGNTAVPLTAFSQGIASLNTAATMPFYTFTTAPTIPAIIRVRAEDTDSVTSLRVPLSSSAEGQTEIRSGRIKISNAYGSELLQQPIAVTAQYWDASLSYVVSTTDSSSSFVVATPPAASAVIFGNYQQNLTAISVAGSPNTAMFTNGVGGFNLAAPGAGNNGSVDMSIPALTGANCEVVPTPLGCYLPSNTGRATFGVYKGSNEFIYLRENY